MEYRPFGRTGINVSAIGFGSWPMSGDRYGPIIDDEAKRAINRALDVGITCVDTAPAYGAGHAEIVVGEALKGRRHEAVLVTKCAIPLDPATNTVKRDSSRANIMREIDLSLKRLQTDYLDVYLIHWPDGSTPFEETAAVMDDVVKAGKTRFVGVSNFTVDQMARFASVRRVDVLQVGYHLFDRRMEREIFPYCAKNGIGVMGYGSLAHGLLTGAFTHATKFDENDWRARGVAFGQPIFKAGNMERNIDVANRLKREVAEPLGAPLSQVALAWVLRNPVVSTGLIGSRNPAEVDGNLAGVTLKLSDADVAKIETIMRDSAGQIEAFTPLRGANEEW